MIFAGQTNLTIELETSVSLAAVTSVWIYYIKPNNAAGQWEGVVSGTKITYSLVSGDLDVPGDWRIWSYVIFANGKIGVGDAVKMTVKKQGDL